MKLKMYTTFILPYLDVCVFFCFFFLMYVSSILKETNPEYSLEGLILWPPDAKNWLTGKDPDAGKDWRQEEKGTTEDEMVGWHHPLNRHESEQPPRDSDGQGGLACCSPLGHKESDTNERLNNSSYLELSIFFFSISPTSNYLLLIQRHWWKNLNPDFWERLQYLWIFKCLSFSFS